MSSNLAPTTFATGIKDILAAVDIYTKKTASAPIDNATSTNQDVPASLTDLIANVKQAGSSVGSGIISGFSAAAGIEINQTSLEANLICSNPELLSPLNSLTAPVRNALTDVIDINKVTATLSGITNIIKDAGLKDLTGVAKVISVISGTTFPVAFKDITGFTNVTANVLKQASAMSIPKAYTQIATGLNTVPSILREATRKILPHVALSSDLNMLVEVSKGPLKNQVSILSPNIIKSFSTNFKLPAKTSQDSYNKLASNIAFSYTNIDSTWNKAKTSSGSLVNSSSILVNASKNMSDILKSSNATSKMPISIIPKTTSLKTAQQYAAMTPVVYPKDTPTQVVGDPKGIGTITYTMPDRTRSVQTSADGSVLITELFPAQQAPVPQPIISDIILATNPATTGYIEPNRILTPIDILDVNQTPIVSSGIQKFNSNAITKTYTDSSGVKYTTTITADGSKHINKVNTDGSIDTVLLANDSNLSAIYSITKDDPLGNTSNIPLSSPLAIGDVVNQIVKLGSIPIDAKDALQKTWSKTNLKGLINYTDI